MEHAKNYDTLKPKRFRFTYDGRHFVAKTASAGASKQYREEASRGVEIQFSEDTGTRIARGVTAAAHLQPLLVSLCTHEINIDPDTKVETESAKPVSLVLVDSWPEPMVREVYDWIREVSLLDEPETLDQLEKQRERLDKRIAELKARESGLKNSQPATAGTSP